MNKEESVELFKKILNENGKSITKSRMIVFSSLIEDRFQSLYEIHKKTKDEINRSSLYRIIEMFENIGVVEKVPIGWKYKIELSDMFINHHHHITCRMCHRVSIADSNPDLERLIDNIASQAGMTNQRHQVEISGICSECRDD